MKRGENILSLSRKVISWLKPFSKRIEIAGSIRRGSKDPGDIDIVLIPKDRTKLESFLAKKGKKLKGGEKESYWKINGFTVEFYYTKSEEWGAALLAYSGRRGSNIGLRRIARNKGFKLSQHGLFDRETGKRIAGKTERSIYKALGRPYKRPEER